MRPAVRRERAALVLAALSLAGCTRCGADRAVDAGTGLPAPATVQRPRSNDVRTAVFTAFPDDRGVWGAKGRVGLLLQYASDTPEQSLLELEKALVARGYQPPLPATDAGTPSDAGTPRREGAPHEAATAQERTGEEAAPDAGLWAPPPEGTLILTRGRFVIEARAEPPGLHVSVDLPLFPRDIARLKSAPASLTSDDLASELSPLEGTREVDRALRVDLAYAGKPEQMHQLLTRQAQRLTDAGWTALGPLRIEGEAGAPSESHQIVLQRELERLDLSHQGSVVEVRYLQPLQVRP